MEIQILNTNVNQWERKFAWFPKVIADITKRQGGVDGKEVIVDMLTNVIWLRPYYRRVEVNNMTNTWFWKYSVTLPD